MASSSSERSQALMDTLAMSQLWAFRENAAGCIQAARTEPLKSGIWGFLLLPSVFKRNPALNSLALCETNRSPPSCQRDYDHKGAVTTVALHPNQAFLSFSFDDLHHLSFVLDWCDHSCRESLFLETRMAASKFGIWLRTRAHTSWCQRKAFPFALSQWLLTALFWLPPTARCDSHPLPANFGLLWFWFWLLLLLTIAREIATSGEWKMDVTQPTWSQFSSSKRMTPMCSSVSLAPMFGTALTHLFVKCLINHFFSFFPFFLFRLQPARNRLRWQHHQNLEHERLQSGEGDEWPPALGLGYVILCRLRLPCLCLLWPHRKAVGHLPGRHHSHIHRTSKGGTLHRAEWHRILGSESFFLFFVFQEENFICSFLFLFFFFFWHFFSFLILTKMSSHRREALHLYRSLLRVSRRWVTDPGRPGRSLKEYIDSIVRARFSQVFCLAPSASLPLQLQLMPPYIPLNRTRMWQILISWRGCWRMATSS